jgi:hypothetical protein
MEKRIWATDAHGCTPIKTKFWFAFIAFTCAYLRLNFFLVFSEALNQGAVRVTMSLEPQIFP